MKHLTTFLQRLVSELFVQRRDECDSYDTKKIKHTIII
jgi:hypothetical protein